MNLIFGGGDIATHGIVPIVGGQIVPQYQCDVMAYQRLNRVMKSLQPSVVINCAGVSHPATIADSDLGQWVDEITVNLIGSYHVAKAAIANSVDTIILIASVAGLYGKPNHSGYSASKAGVRTLVQSLGMEGHDAYAISPGRVDTRMREKDYPGEDPQTRLNPQEVGLVVQAILNGEYEPGDNIIVRRIGYDSHTRVDRGEPWKDYLRVGQPVTF